MSTWRRLAGRTCLAAICTLAGAVAAGAELLPSRPVVVADGLVTISGDVSATAGPDDPGFFDYTDYDRSVLQMVRIDVSAMLKAGPHVALLGEVRTENGGSVTPYALYVRIHPWTARRVDFQLGRIPPTFGAFARRAYASDNPLIGYPLAYQYLTSLRADAFPANADELINMRGRGWLASYSIGDPSPARGVPIASASRWDAGVQVHGETDAVDVTASVTTGTLANPLFRDDNAGPQVAARVALHPAAKVAGLVVGASASRGPFVSASAARAAGRDGGSGGFTQAAWGADVEYSRDHYLVRAESIVSRWTLPAVAAPALTDPLTAFGVSVEGRYQILPGVFAAARVDHLGFSEITGTARRATWDAPVTRVEWGLGYSILRNLLLKASVQWNTRDGGRVHDAVLGAGQLVYWF